MRLVTVGPDSAVVNTIGGKAVFRASGGDGEYTWDAANPGIGTMNPTTGDTSTYTALSVGDNDIVVYDGAGHSALAKISGTPPADFLVSATANPTSLASDNNLSVLTASGGAPTYTWSVTEPGKGNFPNGNTGKSVLYQRYAPGDNGITVTDGRGNSASVIINQP